MFAKEFISFVRYNCGRGLKSITISVKLFNAVKLELDREMPIINFDPTLDKEFKLRGVIIKSE